VFCAQRYTVLGTVDRFLFGNGRPNHLLRSTVWAQDRIPGSLFERQLCHGNPCPRLVREPGGDGGRVMRACPGTAVGKSVGVRDASVPCMERD